MKRSLLIASLLISPQAFAIEPLGPVDIVVIHDPFTFSRLELEEGRFHSCEYTWVDGEYCNCHVTDGFVTWTGWGEPPEIPLSKFTYYRFDNGVNWPTYTRFTYKGVWETTVDGVPVKSPVEIELKVYDHTPNDIYGYLKLTKYDMIYALQAAWR